jgi:homoserine kinase type II
VAVYTDITDAELEVFLEGYDLGRALSFKGIAEGVENSNFLLETERGRFILTVYERRVRGEELPFFIALMQHLAAKGFPCPTPINDRRGAALQTLRGKPAALVSFLTGVSVRRPAAAHCREAGVGLARLHLAAAGFKGRRRNDLGQAAWGALFSDQRPAAERLRPGLSGEIDQDIAMLALAWPRDLPVGIIHADLFPDNVFFDDGKFAAAIDFYFACEDAFAYDLAVCLNAWCFEPDGSFNITAARALVAGYQTLRPLSPAERTGLPILAHGAAMRFFLTRLIDWGRADAGALVRPKDPGEYERKLVFHRSALGRLDLFDVP